MTKDMCRIRTSGEFYKHDNSTSGSMNGEEILPQLNE
jgi:hypothetical protein